MFYLQKIASFNLNVIYYLNYELTIVKYIYNIII